MRINHYVYRLLGAVCAFATIACVDQSFELNDISKEVTVGSGKTTLPIGYIEDKTIGDLLEGQEIDGLTIDELNRLINTIMATRKVKCADVVELNPMLDSTDGTTQTTMDIVEYLVSKIN